jgi:hypothetical protein
MIAVTRTGRQGAEAGAAQQRADAALGQLHVEARLDHSRQVDPAPAHHAVLGNGRPLAHQTRQLGCLLGGQTGLGTRRHTIR